MKTILFSCGILLMLLSCNNDDEMQLEVREVWERSINEMSDGYAKTPVLTKDFVIVPYYSGDSEIEIFERSTGTSMGTKFLGAESPNFLKDKFVSENKLLLVRDQNLYYFDAGNLELKLFSDLGRIYSVWTSDDYYFYIDRQSGGKDKLVFAPTGTLDTIGIPFNIPIGNAGRLVTHESTLDYNASDEPILYSFIEKKYSGSGYQDTLIAVATNLNTLSTIWETVFDTNFGGAALAGGPKVTSEAVVVLTSGSTLMGLDKITGSLLWETPIYTYYWELWLRARSIGNTVLIWDLATQMFAVNGNTGQERWTQSSISWPNLALSPERYFLFNGQFDHFECRNILSNDLIFQIRFEEDIDSYRYRFCVDEMTDEVFINNGETITRYQF